MDNLYLHEEALLLALKDREGTIESGTMYQFALGGSLLSELLLHERIRVESQKRKDFVEIADPTPVGDVLLDECLERIRTSKRRATIETWVSRFSNIGKLKHRIAQQLCLKGILREDEDKILLLFRRKIYPEINPEPERRLIERLREAIFEDNAQMTQNTAILISLAHATSLLKVIFDRKALKSRKKHIERIAAGEMTGRAVAKAVEAIQAAIMAAVIASAVTASTAGS